MFAAIARGSPLEHSSYGGAESKSKVLGGVCLSLRYEMAMTKLSVNINKLATLRNSRGGNLPDIVKGALDIIRFGAHGITVHPRPDERHIRRNDVYALKAAIGATEFNIEGYPSEDFLQLLSDIRPAQATLVPDPPHVLTSNAGWRVLENERLLATVTDKIKKSGARVSVFIDPYESGPKEFDRLRSIGVDRIELYTEKFASHFTQPDQEAVTAVYRRAAEEARVAGLGVNAGHDLSTVNLAGLIAAIPWIDEVSIGHALICDALYHGLERTVRMYLDCLNPESVP